MQSRKGDNPHSGWAELWAARSAEPSSRYFKHHFHPKHARNILKLPPGHFGLAAALRRPVRRRAQAGGASGRSENRAGSAGGGSHACCLIAQEALIISARHSQANYMRVEERRV